MSSLHQARVAQYHEALVSGGHHGEHNMYLFHRDWHINNPNPTPPAVRDLNWGSDLHFGSDFLQMHHEMVKATSAEPHQHMQHASVATWYQDQHFQLPATWTPGTTISAELGYDPDVNVYPAEIRDAVIRNAQGQGKTATQWLTRTTNTPNFTLPLWTSRSGVGAGEPAEIYTGARKLEDFTNLNQLGCALVFPHNRWHGAIGGAMGSTWTAIADPIFYFGVHWAIDRVYDDFKTILAGRAAHPRGLNHFLEIHALREGAVKSQKEFMSKEKAAREADIALSQRLQRAPGLSP